jgi:hypothetical protein
MQRVLRPPFYLKRQTYVVRYQVMLRNTADKANDVIVIAPVPSSREGQEIASPPRFNPSTAELRGDTKYGNQYITWKAKLAPGESRLFTEHFTVSIAPIQKTLPKSALRSDYADKSQAFCAPTDHLQATDERIVSLAKEAIGDATDVGTMLSRINEFVMQRLEYGNKERGLYSATDAIRNIKVDCGGYDTLFAALCIASGIPARIVSGFWAGYEKNEMHAWVEAQLPGGEWVPADPSMESLAREARTKKHGKLGEVGSDRIAFSIGCDLLLELPKKMARIDILQHPFVEASMGEKSFVVETRVETTKA